MKTFKPFDLDDAPEHVRQGCAAFDSALATRTTREWPKVVKATIAEIHGDVDYVVEIAPAVEMLFTWETAHAGDHFWDDAADAAMRAAEVSHTLKGPYREFVDHARKLIGDAEADGCAIDLVGVAIAEPMRWWQQDRPMYLATLTGLKENLRPGPCWITAETVTEWDERLLCLIGHQRRLAASLETFASIGADATIDAIALRLILDEPEPDGIMLTLRDVVRLKVAAGRTLTWEGGHITSSGADPSMSIHWSGERLWLPEASIPESACAALYGRPASDLVACTAIPDGVRLLEVVNEGDGDATWVEARLSPPRCYLDLGSGRHWPVAEGSSR
ncbi:hypothetical protein [Sphingomonas melonis]|uniref:Uncharacterized protein n=1 Tax=Sphingomonas melonis TaxID=152682 RepID=A0A7Y9FKW4_9SPHN|nr:hypothetical protein [Sphingomonas melonis]NYD89184.1 hypothetical protein [Sphingomonas melonis]